jgi:hypothetical protein
MTAVLMVIVIGTVVVALVVDLIVLAEWLRTWFMKVEKEQ